MPIFQRYLLKELVLNALVTFAVITLITIVGGALTFLHKTDYVTLGAFLTAIWFFVGTNLDKTLPMTVLVAVVITYGRAAADNEINSIRASGIHLFTVVSPAFLFGLLGTLVVLHVNDRVAPAMEFAKEELVEASVDGVVRSLMDRGGNSIQLGKNTHVIWGGVDELDRLLNVRIKVYEKGDEGSRPLRTEILAEKARLEPDHERGLLFFVMDGIRMLKGESEDAYADKMRYPIPLREDVREKRLKHHTLAELVAAESRHFEGAYKARTIRSEFHKRIAGAFACILFVLVGVPLAIIFRHGNRMVAFLLAFMIALFVYYPTFILGEVLSKETDLNPLLAIWSGSIVLFALGSGLTWVVFRR